MITRRTVSLSITALKVTLDVAACLAIDHGLLAIRNKAISTSLARRGAASSHQTSTLMPLRRENSFP
jgi:hypothetical protein